MTVISNTPAGSIREISAHVQVQVQTVNLKVHYLDQLVELWILIILQYYFAQVRCIYQRIEGELLVLAIY
jgi:hypothetical protein